MTAAPGAVALITGASGGIGYELARCCAADGHSVVLAARSGGRLEEVAQEIRREFRVEAIPVATDLTDPDAAEQLHDIIAGQGLHVALLINNAGFGTWGSFTATGPDEIRGMVALNIETLTTLIWLELPGMLERRRGQILNVASTAAFQGVPSMAVYAATKAYVLSLTEALADELRATDVTVSVLCPGGTSTGFMARANMETSAFLDARFMNPRRVAEIGYAGMLAGRRLIIPGWDNRVGALLTRFVPRRIAARIAGWMMREYPQSG